MAVKAAAPAAGAGLTAAKAGAATGATMAKIAATTAAAKAAAAGAAGATAAGATAAAAPAIAGAAMTPTAIGSATGLGSLPAAPISGGMTPGTAAAIGAGGTLASGLAQGLMQEKPKESRQTHSMPSVSVGQLGSRGREGPLFGARQDIAGIPRASLAQALLRGGY